MFAVSPMARPLPSLRFLFAFVVVLPAGGCRLPDVNLATREPIKVDINVDLNIYQHGTPESAAAAQAEAEALEEVKRRKYNRQEEIQNLKNQRLVAETHRGTLLLRDQPTGDYGAYVKKTVDEENADRLKLMTAEAERDKRELREVMRERYEANVKNAFPGEWIEVPDPEKPESWILTRKQ